MSALHVAGLAGPVAILVDAILLAILVTVVCLVWRISPYRAALLDHRRAERLHQHSEARYRELVQKANSIVLRIDKQGRVLYINEYAQEYFGYSEKEILGQSIIGTIVPEIESTGRDLSRVIETICANPVDYGSNENENICRDGRRVWISWSNKCLFDESGNLIEILSIGNDITQLKESELRIAESEQKFRTLFEASNDGMVTLEYSDSRLRIVDSNPACHAMFGYEHHELVGRSPLEFTPHKQTSHEEQILEIAAKARSGQPQRFEWPHRRKDGSLFKSEVYVAAFKFQERPMFQAVLRDITEQREMEAQKEDAHRTAEAANRAKSEFLANMSHEIRTPLTAILGYAELMAANAPDGNDSDSAEAILRNGHHLLEIINNILDLSKIEADRIEPELIECRPLDIVAEVVSLLKSQADSKGLTLSLATLEPVPETILTSPLRLKQILINLIGNAVKFTHAGTVRVVPRLAQHSAQQLEIEISDTGIGMSQKQMDQLFQPFVQADGSMTRRFGGTGLGLTISRKLARLLGGDIRVESRLGQGSRFTLVVDTGPLDTKRRPKVPALRDEIPRSAEQPLQERPLGGRRILIAEDGTDNQRIVSMMLAKAGAEVEVVDNGRNAVDRASLEQFDLILMDMQMPVLDGYDATRQLRAAGYQGSIVALTAHAMEGDQQKCLDAGCNGYATKPIDRTSLIAAAVHHVSMDPAT